MAHFAHVMILPVRLFFNAVITASKTTKKNNFRIFIEMLSVSNNIYKEFRLQTSISAHTFLRRMRNPSPYSVCIWQIKRGEEKKRNQEVHLSSIFSLRLWHARMQCFIFWVFGFQRFGCVFCLVFTVYHSIRSLFRVHCLLFARIVVWKSSTK